MKTKKWNFNDITDQTGRVAVVTGSSSGIGLETARVLAAKNAEVIIAVRNRTKGQKAKGTILQKHPEARLKVMLLDLADLASVEDFAGQFKSQYHRLDLLINNAGVMVPPHEHTVYGFELQLGTNHLGHFALTAHLFSILKKTRGSRVVNVSSMGHRVGNIDFDDLQWTRRKYKKWRAYGDSKIANLYFTYALARKLDNGQPVVVAAHPGWTATDLQRHTPTTSAMNYLFAQNTEMGALPTLYAALAHDVQKADFFGPAGFMEMKGYPKKVTSNRLSRNPEIADKLWHVSESLTGVSFEV